jgi:hypothetical protein
MNPAILASIFGGLSLIVILFQFALALGAPWGAASMGGKFPGVYPPKMRVIALVNALIIFGLTVIVFSRAGMCFPKLFGFSESANWFVVAFTAIGTLLNTITPSKIERIWAPVLFIQFACSLWIALS